MLFAENVGNTPYESTWILEDKAGHILGECVINNRMEKEYYSLWKKYSREQIKEMFDHAVITENGRIVA